MRWGKPRKNIKRRDPRYFLNEDMQPPAQETEEEFVKRFERVVNELSNEELLQPVLSEVDTGEEETSIVKKSKEPLYFQDETTKYMINFLRRRVMGVLSFKLRIILFGASRLTFPFSWVAIAALRYAGFSVRKATSTDAIDKFIEKQLDKHMAQTKELLYPGDASLKTIMHSIVQEFIRQIKKPAEKEIKQIESLPEPERHEAVQTISQKLEALKREMQNEPVSS